jgi:uncharacterized protein YsxB (DUF464 family)
MLKASIQRNRDGQIVALEASGHADAGKRGRDIVCAAVSALTQSALLGLERYAGGAFTAQIKDGFLSLRLADAPNTRAEAILETMYLGLLEIAKAYPKNFQLEEYGGESHV